jgi:hypothetical protein
LWSQQKKEAKNVALVAGTKQTLSNLYFLLISMGQSQNNNCEYRNFFVKSDQRRTTTIQERKD